MKNYTYYVCWILAIVRLQRTPCMHTCGPASWLSQRPRPARLWPWAKMILVRTACSNYSLFQLIRKMFLNVCDLWEITLGRVQSKYNQIWLTIAYTRYQWLADGGRGGRTPPPSPTPELNKYINKLTKLVYKNISKIDLKKIAYCLYKEGRSDISALLL